MKPRGFCCTVGQMILCLHVYGGVGETFHNSRDVIHCHYDGGPC